MKAVQFTQFGNAEVLQYTTTDTPQLDDKDTHTILVKIKASGINPIDGKIRSGNSFACKNLILPACIGFDIAGDVIAKVDDVKDIAIGDSILGRLDFTQMGGYSEYCKISSNHVIKKPLKLDYEKVAALPIAGLTAWQALFDHGQLQKGQRILIHAGTGGVGHLAIQLTKQAGAYIITTASHNNHPFVLSLGADEAIDYRSTTFEDIVQDVDLVIDLIGGETGVRSLKTFKSDGLLVTVPTITRDEVLQKAKEKHINATGMLAETKLEQLDKLAHLIEKGRISRTVFC